MRIPRPLAHKLQSKLQIVMSQVELGKTPEAVTCIHELADLINSYVESREEERERHQREHDSDHESG